VSERKIVGVTSCLPQSPAEFHILLTKLFKVRKKKKIIRKKGSVVRDDSLHLVK
jgi:hypothetical protein